MRFLWTAAVLALAAVPVRAAISSGEAARLKDAADVVTAMRSGADIPENIWQKADCVAVIPSVKKAAFIFGGEYGRGALTCRQGRGWSAPAFMQLEKGSWGFQAGAEEVDLVLMVMNRSGVDKLLQDKVSLGAGASVAAGPVGRTAQAGTDVQMAAEILAYSRSRGIFAGLDLSGGVLAPDKEANASAYGPNVAVRDIVSGKTAAPPAARQLIAALNRTARATSGVK